ncbi:MAG TPA: hypothetical protein VGR43_06865, partial [Dehalococcoidia bacterium]|nr:hypothetical protein [Dehalococcoidia bacterium]
AAYLADSRTELSENAGKTIGVTTLKEIDVYDPAVADEAAGANVIASVQTEDGTQEFWLTVVSYRRGRLVGGVVMYAIGASDLEKQRLAGKVKSLAGTMNERIGELLAGVLTATAAGQ